MKIICACPMKSCLLDPIPTFLLKEPQVLAKLAPILSQIVNSSLSSGSMPDKCHPTLKKANPGQRKPFNYRPVSNLSFLSKVVERMVASRLQDHNG